MADVAKITAADVAGMGTDELLDLIATLREQIAEHQTGLDALYAIRLVAFQEARRREPPITQRALAERAGISEVGVIQQLRTARLKAAGA